MTPTDAEEKGAAAFNEAEALVEKKDYKAACSKYLEALAYVPRAKPHVRSMPFTMKALSVGWYNAGCCFARMGRPDDAVTCLRKAFHNGYDDYEGMLKDDDLESLRGTPVFTGFCAWAKPRFETVEYKGRRIRAPDLPLFQEADKTAPHPGVIWFDWVWTFEDELTPEDLEKKKALIVVWQKNLWDAGEGNFAIRRVTLVGGADFYGDFHTPKGFKNSLLMNESLKDAETVGKEELMKAVRAGEQIEFGFTVYRKTLAIPGRCSAYTWLHETGHRLFACEEEYDSPHGCSCVMSTMAKGGKMQWCDKATHSAEQAEQQPPCWEGFILKEFPMAKHPGPGGAMPSFEVRIAKADF